MMKISKIIGMALGFLAIAGCSDMRLKEEGIGPLLIGSVTTDDGVPIEHIQVTLNWLESGMTEVAYTSSEGIFTSYAYISPKGETSLKLTFEDIDGEDNGGIFDTKEETITLLEHEISEHMNENGEINLQMAFHLNRATL